MGEARRRGSLEERRAQAVAAGRSRLSPAGSFRPPRPLTTRGIIIELAGTRVGDRRVPAFKDVLKRRARDGDIIAACFLRDMDSLSGGTRTEVWARVRKWLADRDALADG